MNEEIIGIEVSGEIYPIKDEQTSGKTQTLETNIQELESLVNTHEEEIKGLGKITVESANISIGTTQYEGLYYVDNGFEKKGQLLSLNVKNTLGNHFIVPEVIETGDTYINVRSWTKMSNISYTLELVWLKK